MFTPLVKVLLHPLKGGLTDSRVSVRHILHIIWDGMFFLRDKSYGQKRRQPSLDFLIWIKVDGAFTCYKNVLPSKGLNMEVLSKFAHALEINDKEYLALFHSLMLTTVYLRKDIYESIDSLIERNVKSDVIDDLRDKGYIVTPDIDSKLIERARSLLPRPSVSVIYVVTTTDCNFKCNYCFIDNAVNTKGSPCNSSMSVSTAKGSVTFLDGLLSGKTLEERNVIFYGGEPLLNLEAIKSFMASLEELDSSWAKKLTFSVITNGSLLTKDTLLFLKKNNIRIGVSLDGDMNANSERVFGNGKPTFNKVLKNIEACKDMDMSFTLSVTISNEFIRRKEELIDYIIGLNPSSVAFNLLLPNSNQSPDPEYYRQATEVVTTAFAQFRLHGIYEDKIMRKVKSFMNNTLYFYDCGAAGGNQLVISPDGGVGLCHAYLDSGKYFTTNIHDREFSVETSNTHSYWNRRSPILIEQCEECFCLGICGGGCAYVSERLTGDIHNIDKNQCELPKGVVRWLVSDLWDKTKP